MAGVWGDEDPLPPPVEAGEVPTPELLDEEGGGGEMGDVDAPPPSVRRVSRDLSGTAGHTSDTSSSSTSRGCPFGHRAGMQAGLICGGKEYICCAVQFQVDGAEDADSTGDDQSVPLCPFGFDEGNPLLPFTRRGGRRGDRGRERERERQQRLPTVSEEGGSIGVPDREEFPSAASRQQPETLREELHTAPPGGDGSEESSGSDGGRRYGGLMLPDPSEEAGGLGFPSSPAIGDGENVSVDLENELEGQLARDESAHLAEALDRVLVSKVK
uniref:Uncharacterized protein n=1 Tax=Chromera velia CCMP2878 TaxID=1169474 RepID=A0A0K6S8C9_9ALVE|eukprot:Cvel_25312.t2-p1 / transcript=Cvel_25312.t2 / gene=Cvel_25312 / organism=Chromera_velia_CCMP2878 / gene_product=hypothetical protein / transcript_product=hypothetical protein / location=Cvel_scaffold2849:6919-8018(+) / protein_length=270 / sequence_SO=supercontig / SO=protein_coding / is_pseudo=false